MTYRKGKYKTGLAILAVSPSIVLSKKSSLDLGSTLRYSLHDPYDAAKRLLIELWINFLRLFTDQEIRTNQLVYGLIRYEVIFFRDRVLFLSE